MPLVARSTRQPLEIVDPWRRRATPDLTPRLQPISLANTAPANSPIVRSPLAAGEKRGTTFRAKVLKARAAVVAGLGVDLGRLSRRPDLSARADHRHPVGRSCERLAIRAVTNRHFLRIDLGLIGDYAAMASAIDIHHVSSPIAAAKTDPCAPSKNGARRRRFI